MADRFGFNQIAKKMKPVTNRFLRGGIKLAQEEMKENFDSQSSKEKNELWPDLSYREEPPPKLDISGELRSEALGNTPIITGNKAVLTIDPIDKRGKGYASYHEDGVNQYKGKDEFQREFVTQSDELTNRQVALLIQELDRAFL